MPNPVHHFQLGSNDVEKSVDFYRKLFGWNIIYSDEVSYGLILPEEGITGGISGHVSESYGPYLSVYVKVENITTALLKVEELGGRIIKEKTIISAEDGYMGIFEDISGNTIFLFEAP